MDGDERPMYAFVHGNLALANSSGDVSVVSTTRWRSCVNRVCYADMTLPSAPDESQVA
jgi:hypothetical protein